MLRDQTHSPGLQLRINLLWHDCILPTQKDAASNLRRFNPDRLDDVPLVTVALHEQDGGTTMTFDLTLSEQLTPLAVRGWFDLGILQGWSATLDKLDPHLTTRTWSTP